MDNVLRFVLSADGMVALLVLITFAYIFILYQYNKRGVKIFAIDGRVAETGYAINPLYFSLLATTDPVVMPLAHQAAMDLPKIPYVEVGVKINGKLKRIRLQVKTNDLSTYKAGDYFPVEYFVGRITCRMHLSDDRIF